MEIAFGVVVVVLLVLSNLQLRGITREIRQSNTRKEEIAGVFGTQPGREMLRERLMGRMQRAK